MVTLGEVQKTDRVRSRSPVRSPVPVDRGGSPVTGPDRFFLKEDPPGTGTDRVFLKEGAPVTASDRVFLGGKKNGHTGTG